nr:unnamed protein product [Callosobruchus chinensis]
MKSREEQFDSSVTRP